MQVSVGVLTALRAIGVFVASDRLFCDDYASQCMTHQKTVRGADQTRCRPISLAVAQRPRAAYGTAHFVHLNRVRPDGGHGCCRRHHCVLVWKGRRSAKGSFRLRVCLTRLSFQRGCVGLRVVLAARCGRRDGLEGAASAPRRHARVLLLVSRSLGTCVPRSRAERPARERCRLGGLQINNCIAERCGCVFQGLTGSRKRVLVESDDASSIEESLMGISFLEDANPPPKSQRHDMV